MARVKDDYRSLNGSQKAAMFLLSLDRERSAKIIERMDDELVSWRYDRG